MTDLALNDRLFLSFSAALGLIVAGTGNALFGPRAWWARTALAATGLAASLASVSALIPAYAGPLALGGGATLLLAALARTTQARRIAAGVWGQLRKPRVAWGLVALAGFGLLVGELGRFEALQRAALDEQDASLKRQVEASPYVPDESRLAKTDRGSAIHLLTAGETRNAEFQLSTEQQALQAAHLDDYVIRRGSGEENSNCHGWVFAGGRFAILGPEVETILEENDYESTTAPNPGDICVYRNDANAVAHTALVRSVFDDGTVLVEGKWGRLGVFLHPVERSVYGPHFSYYHSSRDTHLLDSVP